MKQDVFQYLIRDEGDPDDGHITVIQLVENDDECGPGCSEDNCLKEYLLQKLKEWFEDSEVTLQTID